MIRFACAISFGLCCTLPAFAQTGCEVINKVAADAYEKANAALAKRWNASAKTAASIFWYTHDLQTCSLTQTMGVYMTRQGLGKGTQPTGDEFSANIQAGGIVSVPIGSKFIALSDTSVKGAVVPDTVVVNGVFYKKSLADAQGKEFDAKSIEDFLKDPSKDALKGFEINRTYLEQWKALIPPSR